MLLCGFDTVDLLGFVKEGLKLEGILKSWMVILGIEEIIDGL